MFDINLTHSYRCSSGCYGYIHFRKFFPQWSRWWTVRLNKFFDDEKIRNIITNRKIIFLDSLNIASILIYFSCKKCHKIIWKLQNEIHFTSYSYMMELRHIPPVQWYSTRMKFIQNISVEGYRGTSWLAYKIFRFYILGLFFLTKLENWNLFKLNHR